MHVLRFIRMFLGHNSTSSFAWRHNPRRHCARRRHHTAHWAARRHPTHRRTARRHSRRRHWRLCGRRHGRRHRHCRNWRSHWLVTTLRSNHDVHMITAFLAAVTTCATTASAIVHRCWRRFGRLGGIFPAHLDFHRRLHRTAHLAAYPATMSAMARLYATAAFLPNVSQVLLGRTRQCTGASR